MDLSKSRKGNIHCLSSSEQTNNQQQIRRLHLCTTERERRDMREFSRRPLLLLLCTLFLFLSASTDTDTLTPDSPLSDGDTVVSADGTFALGFFAPDPSSKNRYLGIWYNKVSVPTYVWVANRKTPLADLTGTLSLAANGTLLITANSTSTVVWSSSPSSSSAVGSNPVAQILDTGNFVVRDVDDDDDGGSQLYAWQSFDHPTDTLLPGMKLGWNLTSGLNRNLTAWASLTDPSPGPYTMAMDVLGDPQIFLWSGSTRTWRTGPWNGVRFSGIPEMKTYSMFTFRFVQSRDEVYYTFGLKDPSVVSRLIVNQTGSTQRLVWLDQPRQWNLFWFAPKDQCDQVSPCGPMGVCDPNDSPICDCVQGFAPKYPTNWALRDGTGGCVRRTPLDCRNGTDGFVLVSEAKLPDTSSSAVDTSLGLDQCRAKCLGNCSCTAYASADVSGAGCIIWTTQLTDIRVWAFGGQDLYVRVAAADLSPTAEQSHHSGAAAIIAIPVVVGTVLVALVACFVCKIKRRKQEAIRFPSSSVSFNNPYNYQDTDSKDLELPLFDLSTIIAVTDNFSTKNKLGEGGFGPVFMGTLEDGQQIAVKRLAKTSVQGRSEFRNEMELIAKLQHRNLVRLLGCCIHGEEKMLVYEYMPNKSLDVFLFDRTKCTLLDWQTRHEIIMGIARGLLYLHQDSRLRIIHRDLKASNILLDKDMNPKISDFGLARIFGGDETEVNTKKVVGTYGYMSPEYAMDGVFSVKSDVFSFGVLVLEIISGKKNRGVFFAKADLNLLGHAWGLWKEGKSLDLVDESMSPKHSTNEALRCVKVGLLCVQERPEDRPTMSSVVLMLGSESALLPQPKQPGFVSTRGPFEHSSSTSKQTASSVNEMSVTMCEGR
ncbi:receptor-like serine/threonine-protein kinase SD1-8 [Iris pallida]|uniref:Receptor-like serine/threonine-protein kinase n=1 Tax=Iris pallida TaxID=29817 RepID=A0AAX6GEZ6_IRIPA|nr:receptor-like serine/threonine-protein kinase SD1-8 [Iris pallida]